MAKVFKVTPKRIKRIYGFDYQKANCTQADFDWEVLG